MRSKVVLATLIVLLTSSLFAAPVVENTTINYGTNQITINGSGFEPQTAGPQTPAPKVLFNNVALTLVSFNASQIVATELDPSAETGE